MQYFSYPLCCRLLNWYSVIPRESASPCFFLNEHEISTALRGKKKRLLTLLIQLRPSKPKRKIKLPIVLAGLNISNVFEWPFCIFKSANRYHIIKCIIRDITCYSAFCIVTSELCQLWILATSGWCHLHLILILNTHLVSDPYFRK